MYIYHALIKALGAYMIHINLNMIFYTHVEHNPTKTVYMKYYKEKHSHTHTHTHKHTHTHAHTHTHTHTHNHTHTHTHTHTVTVAVPLTLSALEVLLLVQPLLSGCF